jgi:1,4-alpha-glucan branching enzyme
MASATLLIDIQQVAAGEHRDVFRVLGMHRVSIAGELRLVVRAFLPGATAAAVVDAATGDSAAMEMAGADGFFELVLPPGAHPFRYRLRVTEENGTTVEQADPYSFPPTVPDFDLYLVDEVTAVGDSNFRAKAQQAFSDRRKRAGLIMVSHSMSTLMEYCNRCAVLDRCALTMYESVEAAAASYEERMSA